MRRLPTRAKVFAVALSGLICVASPLVAVASVHADGATVCRAIVRSDGATCVYTTSGDFSAQNPAFSRNGSRLFFTVYNCGYDAVDDQNHCKPGGGLRSMPAVPGATATNLWYRDEATNVNGLASWTPATNRIAFAIQNGNIATVASTGAPSTYKQVTHLSPNSTASNLEPTYSRHGNWIVFEQDVPSSFASDPTAPSVGNIDMVSAAGGPVTTLVSSTDKSDNRLPVFSPDGKLILFQRDTGLVNGHLQGNYHLFTINPATKVLTQVTGRKGTATAGDNCDSDASWSPDGRWILDSACYGNPAPCPGDPSVTESKIFLVSPNGERVVPVTNDPTEEDGAPAMSPDGAWIYFESHTKRCDDNSPSQIWRIPSPVRSDGSQLVYRPPASVGASAQNPCYEPSGNRLLFTVFSDNYNNDNPPVPNGTASLYSVPPGGGSAAAIVSHSGNAAVNLPGTCDSAAAGRIAYSSDLVNTDNIWTSLPGGRNRSERQITCYTASYLHAQEPSWSPDGKNLVYELDSEKTPNIASIWTVPATDSCPGNFHPARIVPASTGCNGATTTPPGNHEPNWAPDGKRIVFQSTSTANSNTVNLWTVAPNGCGLTQITKDPNSDTDPSWSPDSSKIVYSTDFGSPSGVANLFIVGATASGAKTRLTSQCSYDGAPSWSPNGASVSFETWPVPDPSQAAIPTVLFRIPAAQRPARAAC